MTSVNASSTVGSPLSSCGSALSSGFTVFSLLGG